MDAAKSILFIFLCHVTAEHLGCASVSTPLGAAHSSSACCIFSHCRLTRGEREKRGGDGGDDDCVDGDDDDDDEENTQRHRGRLERCEEMIHTHTHLDTSRR